MLVVSLITLGSPEQLTGGYLYHRRMAEAAAAHDVSVEFVAARVGRNPFARAAQVIVVDSIAAAVVAPWVWRRVPPRPLAAILHQPPGGIDHGPTRRVLQAVLDRSLYRRCALLMAASAALAADLVASHDLPAERIRVVPPGCDLGQARAVPADLRAGRPVAFLCVGNWVARKGILELLDAFAGLPHELATLHLVGRDDVEPRYTERVRARLAAPDVTARVVVHGAVSSGAVASLYAGADAFVLPSYREPYGTVYGEALAAGLPVVGWRAGNLPHLIDTGREGILLDPGDVAGLGATLRRLASDEVWRTRLSEMARRRGSTLPTWHYTATRFFDELRQLARAGG